MRRFLGLIFLYGVISSLFFITPVFAACTNTETETDFGCIPHDPVLFVERFYGILLGVIGGIAVLSIMYGGYLIMTSTGNPTQLNKGKMYIYYAIAGVLLAIFGFVIMEVVAGDILKIPGFV